MFAHPRRNSFSHRGLARPAFFAGVELTADILYPFRTLFFTAADEFPAASCL